MTRWHWIRHGPTHQTALTGWRDVPADLSDHDQIARLDAHLPRDAVLVSSDPIRARATADRLSQGRLRLPHMDYRREFHFGEWDGKHFRDIAATHPEESRAYWEQPGDNAPPGGESWNQAAERVAGAAEALAADHGGQDIIVVAHFGVILTRLATALGKTPNEALGQKIDPLSVTEIHHTSAGWEVVHVNHTP